MLQRTVLDRALDVVEVILRRPAQHDRDDVADLPTEGTRLATAHSTVGLQVSGAVRGWRCWLCSQPQGSWPRLNLEMPSVHALCCHGAFGCRRLWYHGCCGYYLR